MKKKGFESDQDKELKPQRVILVGGFSELFELCELCGYTVFGYVDSEKRNDEYNYLGDDSVVLNHSEKYNEFPVIISPDNPQVRKELFDQYSKKGFKIISLISPNAYISESAQIGEGCIIQSFCNVSCNSIIGKGVRLNTYANVMHDVSIDDFSIIAPNAVILGRCKIGRETYIGGNATILPNVSVGDGCIIGAAAVVTKNIKNGLKVCGNPAKEMK